MKKARIILAGWKKTEIDPITDYARKVVGEEILAGPHVMAACERHLNDRKNGPKRGLFWSLKKAMHTINFFKDNLPLPGEGNISIKPFILQPSQEFIVGSIFGWLTEDGSRRFQTAYIEEGKGNGKTPMAAGIGLYGLCADREMGAEIYAAAVTREQAGILFKDAKLMRDNSPSLKKRIDATTHNLAFIRTNSFFRPVSSEGRSLDGKRVHFALIDEIHEHRTDVVVEKMSAGIKGRRQPLIFEITNALALDTPIATASGWAMMGDIKIGDRLFDERGNPCNATAVTDAMVNHECYRLIFDDGAEIIADAGHLWRTWQKWSFRSRSEVLKNIPRREGTFLPRGSFEHLGIRTTEYICQTVKYKKFSNHRIELARSLILPEAKLPISPYVLGAWLGDGNSKDSGIVIPQDKEDILGYIRQEGISVGRRRPVRGKKPIGLYGLGVTGRGRSDSLHCDLKRLSLLKNKHIPVIYLRASIGQRWNLLQGLMDTDGSISARSGRCVFTQSRERLAYDVAELITTLGMKCTLRYSNSTLQDKKFNRWDVFFYPPWNELPFRLKQKLKNHYRRHGKARMSGNRRIVGIESIPSVPVRCLAVDSASRLFLAGRSMIPTHNSGYDQESICYRHHKRSIDIVHGMLEDDSWFAYVCGLEEEEEEEGWRNPKLWIKANPLLDIAVTRRYLAKQVREAESMPSKAGIVKRLNFCIWTKSLIQWIKPKIWKKNAGDVDPELLKGKKTFAGLDLSGKNDLSALILVIPVDGLFYVICYFWAPEEGIAEREFRDGAPYVAWEQKKFLKTTPGPTVDYGWIAQEIKQICNDFEIVGLAYDRWGFKIMKKYLDDAGVKYYEKEKETDEGEGVAFIPFGQGYASMSPAITAMEDALLEGQIRHGMHPVLTWNAANAELSQDPAGNRKIVKGKNPSKRVDGIVALAMAMSLAKGIKLESKGPSIYETRGLATINIERRE